MVDQSFGLGLAQASSVTAGNKGDSVTVKAEPFANGVPNDLVNPSVLVLGERAGDSRPFTLQPPEYGIEAVMDWNSEVFARVSFLPLRISQPNRARSKVDVLKRNGRLAKPASGVKADLRTNEHPIRLFGVRFSELRNMLVGKLRFDLLRVLFNTQLVERVGLGELHSDCFTQKLRKKFQLKKCRVVPNVFAVDSGSESPSDVGRSVGIVHLTRVHNVRLSQKRSNGLPSASVPPLGITVGLPVGSEVSRDPRAKSLTAFPARPDALFVCRGFIGKTLSFARLCIYRMTKAGRFFFPNAGIQVASAEIPKRGPLMLTQVSHEPPRVSHGLPNYKCNELKQNGPEWNKSGLNNAQNATVTLRGNRFPSYLRDSLTSGSQIDSQGEQRS